MPFNVNAVTNMILGILMVNVIYILVRKPKDQLGDSKVEDEDEVKEK